MNLDDSKNDNHDDLPEGELHSADEKAALGQRERHTRHNKQSARRSSQRGERREKRRGRRSAKTDGSQQSRSIDDLTMVDGTTYRNSSRRRRRKKKKAQTDRSEQSRSTDDLTVVDGASYRDWRRGRKKKKGGHSCEEQVGGPPGGGLPTDPSCTRADETLGHSTEEKRRNTRNTRVKKHPEECKLGYSSGSPSHSLFAEQLREEEEEASHPGAWQVINSLTQSERQLEILTYHEPSGGLDDEFHLVDAERVGEESHQPLAVVAEGLDRSPSPSERPPERRLVLIVVLVALVAVTVAVMVLSVTRARV